MPLKKRALPPLPGARQEPAVPTPKSRETQSNQSHTTPTTSVSSLSRSSAEVSRSSSLATSFESAMNFRGDMAFGSPTPTQESTKFFERRPLATPTQQPPTTRRYTPPRYSYQHPRASARSPTLFNKIMVTSQTLANLIRYLPWTDFFSLANTCRQYNTTLFEDSTLKDIIFSQFVPGYRYVTLHWDLNYAERQVRTGLIDLNLLGNIQ
jgi:hypothetical protein